MEQYTLPGVMNYLRTEYQQRERAKIEWEIERADLKSRVTKLEMENHQLNAERDSLKRHLNMLVAQLRRRREEGGGGPGGPGGPSGPSGAPIAPPGAPTPDTPSGPPSGPPTSGGPTVGGPPTAPTALLTTITDSREFLSNCLADIKSILLQCGAPPELDTVPKITTEFPQMTTYANFGVSAKSVCLLPENRIAVGTLSGDLFVFEQNLQMRKIHQSQRIQCMQFVDNLLYVACANEILIFDTNFTLVNKHKVSVIDIAFFKLNNTTLFVVLIDGNTKFVELKDKLDFHTSISNCIGGDFNNVNLVAACNFDLESACVLVDLKTYKFTKRLKTLKNKITAIMCFERFVVLGTENGDINVVDFDGEVLGEAVAGHRARVTSLCALNSLLVVTCNDGRASLWSLPNLEWRGRFMSHDSAFGALSSDACDETVCIGGGDGLVRVYTR